MMDSRIQNEDVLLFEGQSQPGSGDQCNLLGTQWEGNVGAPLWSVSLFLVAYQAISQRLGWPRSKADSLGNNALHRYKLMSVSPINNTPERSVSVVGVKARIASKGTNQHYDLELFSDDWFAKYYPNEGESMRKFARFVLNTAFAGRLTEAAFRLTDIIFQMGNAYARQLQLAEIVTTSVTEADTFHNVNLATEDFLASFKPIGDIVADNFSEGHVEYLNSDPNRATMSLTTDTLFAYTRLNRVARTPDPAHPINFQGFVEDLDTDFLCSTQMAPTTILSIIPIMLGITNIASIARQTSPRPSGDLLDLALADGGDATVLLTYCEYLPNQFWSQSLDKTQGGSLSMWNVWSGHPDPRAYPNMVNSSLCLALCRPLVEPSVDPAADFSLRMLTLLREELETVQTRLGNPSLYDGEDANVALVVHEILQRIGFTGSHASLASLLLNIYAGNSPEAEVSGDIATFIKQQLRVHTALLIALRKQLRAKPALTQAENVVAATVGSLSAEIAKEKKNV